MHFRFEHVIATSVETLERIVLDPRFVPLLPREMKMIAEATVVERRELPDGTLERVERFRPSARPPAFARGVTPEMLQWLQRTHWNRATHAGTWVIEPSIPDEWRRYFDGRGSYRIEPREAARTARVVEGDVELRVPLVRGLAERYAVSQLRAQFDGEAVLLADLASRADPFA